MTRIALDSNILIYFSGVKVEESDAPKVQRVVELLPQLKSQGELVVPVQALGETFIVLKRNGWSAKAARKAVTQMKFGMEPAGSSDTALEAALQLAVDHKLQFWDSLILSAAAEAGCSLLLSEDMQDGFVSRGVTVANPFAEKLHPKLARLLT
jgi:predicted nucleic acid-binding protein